MDFGLSQDIRILSFIGFICDTEASEPAWGEIIEYSKSIIKIEFTDIEIVSF
jgi:hypothetical protein